MTQPNQVIADPLAVLQATFGFSAFRPGQLEIIQALLEKHDVLALMPTGGGKSVCFQVPALCLTGMTLVISPLISLMTDQVLALRRKSIPAEYLSSQQTWPEQSQIMSAARQNQYRLLYIAPERLRNDRFSAFIRQLPLAMIVIDEAHCLSEWGHDFRPSYRAIGEQLAQLDHRPVIGAFTATATPATQADIVSTLDLHPPSVFKQSFLRKNIQITATHCPTSTHKLAALGRCLNNSLHKPTIIYCSSRETTEQLTTFLQKTIYTAQPNLVATYHAHLSPQLKSQTQHQFLINQHQVLVATTAFGMGVDKPDVRQIIHYHLPSSIENYYQEIGRAGRDGQPSSALLLFSASDIELQLGLMADSPAQKQRSTKLHQMLRLASTHACRHHFILHYFEESISATCQMCDNCLGRKYESDMTEKKIYRDLQIVRRAWQSSSPALWQDVLSNRLLVLVSIYRPRTNGAWQTLPGVGSFFLDQPEIIHDFSQCYGPLIAGGP